MPEVYCGHGDVFPQNFAAEAGLSDSGSPYFMNLAANLLDVNKLNPLVSHQDICGVSQVWSSGSS
jgi:hypothetical protein